MNCKDHDLLHHETLEALERMLHNLSMQGLPVPYIIDLRRALTDAANKVFADRR